MGIAFTKQQSRYQQTGKAAADLRAFLPGGLCEASLECDVIAEMLG
jgi:hypothetical protein